MAMIRKIFLVFIVYFTFFLTASYSEVVNKVEVKGNVRISQETIMVFGDVSTGKNYQASDVNLLIKKLYESNFFSNITVELKDNTLIIFVEENPLNVLIHLKRSITQDKYSE